MNIALATEGFSALAGHAGRARDWLVFDCAPGAPPPSPWRVTLTQSMLFHYWADDTGLAGHPLDGIRIIVAKGAGESFQRRMRKRGVDVLLMAESDPATALERVLAGEAHAGLRPDTGPRPCRFRDRRS